MTFIPRKWQIECHARERQHRITYRPKSKQAFMIEACPGAGKSSMAAMIAKEWLNRQIVNHVLIIAPWKPIVASICAKCSEFHLETSRSLFRGTRYHPVPFWDVTVMTNTGTFSSDILETLRQWRNTGDGWKYGVIVDEVHHCSIAKPWGQFAETVIENAEYWVAMSGTPFRSDGFPISGLQYDSEGTVIPDYQLTYRKGVEAGYVRDVTVRWFDGEVMLYDKKDSIIGSKKYSELTNAEINRAKTHIFDSDEKLAKEMIQTIHTDLMELRASSKEYANAAALFVCRPGTNDGEETRRLHKISQKIKQITGIDPVTVSHSDKDAEGKIEAFRRGDKPYLVAVNMVAEGCDIPRIISIGMMRFIESPLLIRQIVGRAIRRQADWDNRPATIYAPKISSMADELSKLYEEGQAGVALRKPCESCGELPCICIRNCERCGNDPCDCERCDVCNRKMPQCICDCEPRYEYIDSDAKAMDGTFNAIDVDEVYIQKAQEIAFHHSQFRGSNSVWTGALLKIAGVPISINSTTPSEEQERRSLIEKGERLCKRLSRMKYDGHEALCFSSEIATKFNIETWTDARRSLSIDQCKRLNDLLISEILKVV
jgi:superfamily II DNA or RNA helicase